LILVEDRANFNNNLAGRKTKTPLNPPYHGEDGQNTAFEYSDSSRGNAVLAPRLVAFYNQNGVDAEHAEGVVHDVIYGGEIFWFVGDEVI